MSIQRILLIDDDIKFCRLTADYLGRHGFQVTFAHDGLTSVPMVLKDSWDAIILDVMLPGQDGWEVLRKIRELSQVPILMFTALGEETDRIVGLELGADDYLPKAYSPRELLARLKAVLRRSNSQVVQNAAQAIEVLEFGSLRLDLSARVTELNDEMVFLTPVEFDLLAVLARAKGRIKTREQLLNEIRDRSYDVVDRSIDVHISCLRKKLKDDPKHPRFIRTVRSAGYMFIEAEEQSS